MDDLVQPLCTIAAETFTTLGAQAREKAKRYTPAGTHPGHNANGDLTTNTYTEGYKGVCDRITDVHYDNSVELPGYYETIGKGAVSSEHRIPDPGVLYNLVADIIPLAVPAAYRFLSSKVQEDKKRKALLDELNAAARQEQQDDTSSVSFRAALKNLHYTQTNNDRIKALPPPKNNALEKFRKAANSPFFANNDFLEKVDTHLQNRNNS